MSENDFLRRKDVLDEILKWRLESGPISTIVYTKVEKMPAANHAETGHLDNEKERQLRDDYDRAEDEILELKAKLETAAVFAPPGYIERNWRKSNILHDPVAALANQPSRFKRITDPKGLELIEQGLTMLRGEG